MRFFLVFLMAIVSACCFCSDPTIAFSAVAKVEVCTALIPVTWATSIVRSADRDAFLAKTDYILVNGGYFNAAHEPDGLVLINGESWGKLRDDGPYSGFVWSDISGKIHIERRAKPPEAPVWAIQSGPLLVESGKSAINTSPNTAPRSVLALRGRDVLVVRTGNIGLKDLAEGLVAVGVDVAINLDGGPSADLRARVDGVATDRPGRAATPYGIGFFPAIPPK